MKLPYQPALDGLRGIALLLVLTYHGGLRWFSGSYLGVSTFFTLSGFLITALLLLEQERRGDGRLDLGSFWARRVRRLLPAALAGIALAVLAAALVPTPTQLVRLPWDVAAALLYFANLRFMTSGHSYWEMFSRPSPLQHLWSLSIEEQFYLAYPLLLLGVTLLVGRRRAPLRTVLAALAVASTATMVALSLAGAIRRASTTAPTRAQRSSSSAACWRRCWCATWVSCRGAVAATPSRRRSQPRTSSHWYLSPVRTRRSSIAVDSPCTRSPPRC